VITHLMNRPATFYCQKSWAFGDNKNSYSFNDSDVDLDDYTTHNIWSLSSSSIKSSAKGDRTPFENTHSTEIDLELV